MRVHLRPSNSASIQKSGHRKRFALEIARRIAKFQRTNRVKDLHPTASRIGDIISIPRVPWSTFCTINRLIEGPELESARHWKVCFDLARPLSKQSLRHCRGTLSYKMPSSTHELLANFASLLQQEMWDLGSENSFYPPEVRHRRSYILNSGSADVWLKDNGVLISKKQPDGGLKILNAEYPFLVLEIAHSEADKHALRKAKDYIRYSQGKIIYVIVISVYHSSNPVNAPLDSEEFSAGQAGESTTSSSSLSSLKCFTPTAPSELDTRYGIAPNVDAQVELPVNSSSAMLESSLTSNSVQQSLDQAYDCFLSPTLRGNHSAYNYDSFEASTYSSQDSLKVWVFKRAILDDPGPSNLSGVKIDARPIIECAEVFPKRPRQQDLSFDILWSELSKRPNQGPHKKFTVHLDLLHQLAKDVFLQDTSLNEDYDIDAFDYPAVENTHTTQNSNLTCSQISLDGSSESSHSADPSYGM